MTFAPRMLIEQKYLLFWFHEYEEFFFSLWQTDNHIRIGFLGLQATNSSPLCSRDTSVNLCPSFHVLGCTLQEKKSAVNYKEQ